MLALELEVLLSVIESFPLPRTMVFAWEDDAPLSVKVKFTFALSVAPARVKPLFCSTDKPPVQLLPVKLPKPTLPLSVRVVKLGLLVETLEADVVSMLTVPVPVFAMARVAALSLSALIVKLCDPENVRLVRLLSVRLVIAVDVVFVELSVIVSAVALKVSVPKLNNPAPFRLIATEVRAELGLSFIAEIVKSWLAVAVMFSVVNALSF